MAIDRRELLCLAGATAVVAACPQIARAETYPMRPVRILVGYAAGGGLDIAARLIGQWLSERLQQQFVVENRTGAATNIATEAVVRAPPDGYTLLLVNAANAINATYYESLSFNFIRDIAPVAGIGRFPYFMAVNPAFPANNVREFIAYAKANPRKVNMGTGGAGGPDHASGELLQLMTGIQMTHVPYRGTTPALTDLLSGQVQMVFCTIPSAIQYVKAGTLRAIAVTSATRLESMPEIPTVGETVPGFESDQGCRHQREIKSGGATVRGIGLHANRGQLWGQHPALRAATATAGLPQSVDITDVKHFTVATHPMVLHLAVMPVAPPLKRTGIRRPPIRTIAALLHRRHPPSALKPAALTRRAQRAACFPMPAANSGPVSPETSRPRASSLAFTSVSACAALAASNRLATTSGGVPARSMRPNQTFVVNSP
jgi:tripartite-type tricarboxylate transporter receptor subunit TctC